MSWISKIFSSGAGSFVDKVSIAAKRFITTDKDRNDFSLALEGLLQERDSEVEQTIRAELGAKERVLVAELQQGDNFTKRARPMVVYSGLAFTALNYVLLPIFERIAAFMGVEGLSTEPLPNLPTEFWYAWGGITSTWVIGRTAEKRGVRHQLVSKITGSMGSRLTD